MYRSSFERLWEENSNAVIANGKPEHAAAILSVFFSKAVKRVRLLCKNLNPKVYDEPEVLNALRTAVEKNNVTVEILVEDEAAKSQFLELVQKYQNERKTQVKLQQNAKRVTKSTVNFAYADDHAFRFEPDNGEMQAIASAWNKEIVEAMDGVFQTLKNALLKADATSLANPLPAEVAQS